MFCSKCGNKASQNAVFCKICGNKFQKSAASVTQTSPPAQAKQSKEKRKIIWPVIIAAGVIITAALVFILLNLSSPKLEITSYYPESGGQGTFVLVELNKRVDPEDIRVLYGSDEIQGSLITDKIIGINIPLFAVSDEIKVEYKKSSTKVPFEVIEQKLIKLFEETAQPSSQIQTLNSNGDVSITLPENFLSQPKAVTVSKVENPAVISDMPNDLVEVYDISIEGLTKLDGDISIGMKYDPEWFDEDDNIEELIEALRWDEETGTWVNLFYYVDEDTSTVHFLTDHLSFFTLSIKSIKFIGLLKTTAIVGVVSYSLEWLANDVYISHADNIRILHSAKAVQNAFPDEDWRKVMSNITIPGAPGYRYIYPFFVQDIGNILEAALKSYLDLGFPDPTTSRFAGSIYRRRVKVKVDSYWNFIAGGEFNYHAFWDQINVPTEILKYEVFDPVLNDAAYSKKAENYLTHILAHELFHTIQRTYYGMFTDYKKGKHLWWMESTADYAANDIAWKRTDSLLLDRLGSRLFDYSLNTTGRKAGTFKRGSDLDYEYLSASFIRFLVQELKCDFKDLVIYTAAAGKNTEPLDIIAGYISEKTNYDKGFESLYVDFLLWTVDNSELKLSDFDDPDNKEIVATDPKTVYIPENEASLLLERSAGYEGNVYIYRAGPDQNTAPDRITVLNNDKKDHTIDVKAGDTLYFIVANILDTDQSTSATISTIGKENEEGSTKLAEKTFSVMKNASAKVWAVKIDTSDWTITPDNIGDGEFNKEYEFVIQGKNLTDDIKDVEIEYDFGDNTLASKGTLKASVSSRGLVEVKIPYTYEAKGVTDPDKESKFTISAKILSKGTQIGSVMADITIKPVSVSILPPRIVTYELTKGASEALHTFSAYARPDGLYKFEWDFGDGSPKKTTQGTESTIEHTYQKTGEFYPKVTLYTNDNKVLASDSITIILERSDQELETRDRWVAFDKEAYLPGEQMDVTIARSADIPHRTTYEDVRYHEWTWEPADQETADRYEQLTGKKLETGPFNRPPHTAFWVGGSYNITGTFIQEEGRTVTGTFDVKYGNEGYWKRIEYMYPENQSFDSTDDGSGNIKTRRTTGQITKLSYDITITITYRDDKVETQRFTINWDDLPEVLYPEDIISFEVKSNTWKPDLRLFNGFVPFYNGKATAKFSTAQAGADGDGTSIFTTQFVVPSYGMYENATRKLELAIGIIESLEEGYDYIRINSPYSIYALYEYIDE